jgi:hypothetical protein
VVVFPAPDLEVPPCLPPPSFAGRTTACPAWTMWRRTAPQSSRRSRRIRRPSTRNSGAVLTPDVRRIAIGFALGFRVGRGAGARPSLKLHGCRRRPSAGGSPQPLSNHYRRCRMSIRIDCRVARVGPTTRMSLALAETLIVLKFTSRIMAFSSKLLQLNKDL